MPRLSSSTVECIVEQGVSGALLCLLCRPVRTLCCRAEEPGCPSLEQHWQLHPTRRLLSCLLAVSNTRRSAS